MERILVVDDERPVCELLAEQLSLEGFQCRACLSGEEALRLLEREPSEAIIADLRMPGMSGLTLLDECRRKYPKSAFLIITGVDDARIVIDAMKQGAADYLLKPLQSEIVIASVKRALERRQLELDVENYRHKLEEMVEDRTRRLQAAMKRVELVYDETLEALGAALDLRDTESAGHSRRVTRYCLAIAKAMGCSGEDLKQMARGSYLHDIGRIGIPDSILMKEGKLTPEETTIMQSHARIGYDLLSRVPFLTRAAEIVLTHQERFDGTGYPQGLAGEEIPLGARIFAVADTLDAMTSDRPYRRALPFQLAREEIVRESGHQFDPEVVRVFLSIAEKVWEEIRFEAALPRVKAKAGWSGDVHCMTSSAGKPAN